ncbi:MAG: ABC transporter ATP-binding protein [Acidimicrobiales bacterium]
MATVCELKGVLKRYGGRVVLAGTDLVVRAGEMVAVTGPTGSGKTTLLNIIALLEAPDVGRVRLFGKGAPAPGSRGATHLRRNRLSYLFQNYALIDNETVGYNLRVAQEYVVGRRDKKRRDRAGALERVGLSSDVAQKKVFELSGGEQQRVAIARLLLKPSELVLADEPTGSLDSANRDAVLVMLREMNEAGKTLVIVTHDPTVAAACTREVRLRT